MLSRNKQAMFYALQARIAEARFDDPSTRIRMLIRAGEGSGLEFQGNSSLEYSCRKTR